MKLEHKVLLCPHCGTPHASGLANTGLVERLDRRTNIADFRCGTCGGNVWNKPAVWISFEVYKVYGTKVGEVLWGDLVAGNGCKK